MIVETAFDIGNNIFFLHNHKFISSKVQGIKIEVRDTVEITYLHNREDGQMINGKVDGKLAFKTKEDLLKSL
jgi:hypothetical protein